MRDQGLINLFPQNANFNTGAYETLENELADWIAAGGTVKIDIQLNGYQNGRQSEVNIKYHVFDEMSGTLVHKQGRIFNNDDAQTFQRVSKQEILERLNNTRQASKMGAPI